jgi:hypothetical protein
MKLLIAVKSCQDDKRLGCHDTIRKTWGFNTLPADLLFFMGGPSQSDLKSDERLIDSADDYDSLPNKTRSILRWSLVEGYDFIFLCDVDTFLIPSKLFQTNFQNFDYSGRFGSSPKIGSQFQFKDGRGIRHEHCHPWASGGFGYFLSRKAARIIANIEPTFWAEDMYIGNTLGPDIQSGNITATDLQHFENEASWHYPAHQLGWRRERMQVWMYEMQQRYRI